MFKLALIALCASVFTLIAFVIPVQAGHMANAPYFCTTMDAAMETVRLQKAEKMDELRERATYDEAFKCWLAERDTPFIPLELVHQYYAFEAPRGVIKALAPDGTVVYLFGTMHFIDWLMHAQGA
jgi:hypothetical protein